MFKTGVLSGLKRTKQPLLGGQRVLMDLPVSASAALGMDTCHTIPGSSTWVLETENFGPPV